MIRQLRRERYRKVENALFAQLGDASLEWLYHFETARNNIAVYASETFSDCMLVFKEINVIIVTRSPVFLEEFLKKLHKEKAYAFRCAEWMAPTIIDRFPLKQADSRGVVLLTYSANKSTFSKYFDDRYSMRILSEDDANEIIAHSACHWSPDFVRERIREGAFLGIYQGNELVSWVGTLWESTRACEIGFAFTKEEYRKKGLMKTLTSVISKRILQKRKIPLIHTVETNIPAIKVAEALGYNLKARDWAYFYSP